MRIGIDYTPALNQGAGIGRYTRELVGALLRQPPENHYVLIAPRRTRWPVPPLPSHAVLRRLPLGEWAMSVLWHRMQLPLSVERFTGPIDVFHAPDFVLPPTSARTVLTVHDLSFVRFPDEASPSLVSYLSRAVPRSVARADLILADSAFTKHELMDWLHVPEDRIEVVPCGVGARFEPVRDPEQLQRVLARYGLEGPYVMSLASLEPRKNLDRLLTAFARLIADRRLPHELVLAGGRGRAASRLAEQVRENGLQERVHLTGFVPDADLPALLSGADLFVYPSLYEGFGLPPLEAMACGTPVVCSNAASLPEVVGDAACLVSPTDVDGIAAGMASVLSDAGLNAGLVARGLAQARSYTWEAAAVCTLAVYRRLAPLRVG